MMAEATNPQLRILKVRLSSSLTNPTFWTKYEAHCNPMEEALINAFAGNSLTMRSILFMGWMILISRSQTMSFLT
jgi:hypothetical protein